MSFLLLNSGDKVLLNDGSSAVLLNSEDVQAGLTISGQHSNQSLYVKSPEILSPVEFTFRIKAGIIKLEWFAEAIWNKLSVCSFDSRILKEAFVLEPINKLQFKLKKIKETLERQYKLETVGNLLSMASESDLIKLIGTLFKK